MSKYNLQITENNKINIVDNNNNIIKADIHIMEIGDYVSKGIINLDNEQYAKINEILINDREW